MSDKNRTEKAEFTVLCLIQDGNWILLQNRVKKIGRDILYRVVM